MEIDMLNAGDFYDQASGFYDAMTRFKKRQQREKDWIKQWRNVYQFNSALDAGCGTGSTALALAQEGIRTTGIDISDNMIKKAGENAPRRGISNIEFIASSFEDAGRQINRMFDAIFCLGNSLVHIQPGKTLDKSIQSFAKLLNPGGVLIIQLLNYDKIMKNRDRIIDIYREESNEFIRFYDFGENILNFNILRIDWSREPVQHQLQTTRHYPYREYEIRKQLLKYGISIENIYGNIKMEDYHPETSPNLVIAARKKQDLL
jgi:glycine/sarcosine N-methyltransferase